MNSLNLHVLFSFAAGNPNRDDAGSPKAVSYGGATRSRISSQAMTRPKRLQFEAESTGERTSRSALVGAEIARLAEELLTNQGTTVDAKLRSTLLKGATKAALSLVMDPAKADKKAASAGTGRAPAAAGGPEPAEKEEAEAGDTLVWLAESEMIEAAQKLATATDGNIDPTEFVHTQTTESLSIAAFGRMFAQRPDLQNEAAIQRAHAFTTHENEVEVDYFTAVDDLRVADRGAGHINMTMLTGGVYYWHCNIDARQLFATWTGADKEGARDKLAALFGALFEALPTGKQNTTGYQGLPALVLVVPARSAVSLQTAFETPVQGDGAGYLLASTKALIEEHAAVCLAKPSHFGSARVTAASTAVTEALDKAQSDDVPMTRMNLDELAIWCADQVLAEEPGALAGKRT